MESRCRAARARPPAARGGRCRRSSRAASVQQLRVEVEQPPFRALPGRRRGRRGTRRTRRAPACCVVGEASPSSSPGSVTRRHAAAAPRRLPSAWRRLSSAPSRPVSRPPAKLLDDAGATRARPVHRDTSSLAGVGRLAGPAEPTPRATRCQPEQRSGEGIAGSCSRRNHQPIPLSPRNSPGVVPPAAPHGHPRRAVRSIAARRRWPQPRPRSPAPRPRTAERRPRRLRRGRASGPRSRTAAPGEIAARRVECDLGVVPRGLGRARRSRAAA